MECERFKKLVKSWYLQVQEEALAPARMVSFMKQHIADCRTCLMDPTIRREVDKITEIVLPPSKVRVVNPPQKEEAAPEVETAEEETQEEEEAVEEEGDDEEEEEKEEEEETETEGVGDKEDFDEDDDY